MHVIHTDFSKAFDSVNRTVILHKLANFNIPGIPLSLITWLGSYLSNHSCCISFNGCEVCSFSHSASIICSFLNRLYGSSVGFGQPGSLVLYKEVDTKRSQVICYFLKSSPIRFSYSLGGLNVIQDIDATFDDKLRFESHCLNVCNRESRISLNIP